jgi:hypothetical protein
MATLPEIPEIDAIFVFLNGKAPLIIIILGFDSTLNFAFRTFFYQHFSVIAFDLSSFSQKKRDCRASLKTPEPLEIKNIFF